VIINGDPTPLDHIADLVIRERIGSTMMKLLSQLPG